MAPPATAQASKPTPWLYDGRPVTLAITADIPGFLRPNGKQGDLIQRVLNLKPPLDPHGLQSAWSAELNDVNLLPLTIEVGQNYPRTWAVHRDHRAEAPELSPFATLPDKELRRRKTSTITVEVVETAGPQGTIMVVRAYPGDYVPPLPWMGTAPDAIGGEMACLEFWREHAYLITRFMNRSTAGTRGSAPKWFTDAL